jgi:hypothetical protein
MTDRVDVLRAPQAVQDGAILSLDDSVAAFDVHCKIYEVSANRAQALLGTYQQSAFLAHFYPKPEIKQNDTLRVRTSGARYVVKVVHRYPAPHDCHVQVCELTADMSTQV